MKDDTTLRLQPVCVLLNAKYSAETLSQLACTIDAIHKAGWCHLDIRQENVLWDVAGLRATLIDREFATRIGAPAPAKMRTTEPVCADRDSAQCFAPL